jgi:hypothetical protein
MVEGGTSRRFSVPAVTAAFSEKRTSTDSARAVRECPDTALDVVAYTSTLADSALCSMNTRRGSTLSPISSSKMVLASSISLKGYARQHTPIK